MQKYFFINKKNFRLFIGTVFLTACTSLTKAPLVAPETGEQAAKSNVELGMGYLQQGDMQRAKRKLLLALQQSPDSAQAHEAMGYFQENTGDKKAAENSYLRAISLDPKSGRARNNYGTFLCRVGRYQEADQQFALALQDPTYLNTAQAYENAGLCAMQIPDDGKASAYFNKAVLQDPRLSIPWLELGQLSYKQASYTQAQQYLNHYFQLVTEPNAEALWLGVRVARQLNDTESAGRYTLMLQSKHPNSAEYRELLASQKSLPAPKRKRVLYF